jgi:hypothetical protein
VDSDFAGNWDAKTAHGDPMISKTRSGWVITFAQCPVTWSSKLQTLTALSTTEAEYISLSNALRDVIPLMELLKEVQARNIINECPVPVIHCKVFEDNAGALEMAKTPKIRPRTKHINNYYHHFREYVENKTISLHSTLSIDQIADILTKPLQAVLFKKHRYSLQRFQKKKEGETEYLVGTPITYFLPSEGV